MIKYIILDDESEGINVLKKLLEPYEWLSLSETFQDPEEGLEYVHHQSPDLIFLDIEMPGMNGFEFLKSIENARINTQVIFTTAFDQYAIRAIKHRAFDYLLKPVDQSELAQTLNAFKEYYESLGMQKRLEELVNHSEFPMRIRLNTRSGFLWVNQKDIVYCEAASNYSIIYLKNDRKETTSMTLGRFEQHLTLPFFKRIGRSLIINTKYLHRVDRKLKECTLDCDGDQYVLKVPDGVEWPQ